MSDVIVLGAGMCGLTTAMMLARDGLDVTVLERDPSEPPDGADAAWQRWDRPGVAQFHQPHNLHARCRHVFESALPEVPQALEAAGALRYDPLALMPPSITDRAPRDGDDRFWTWTGRRPVVESVVAGLAQREPGVTVRRGVRATALLTGPEAIPGVANVTGVRTADADLRASLVVDATGRRSAARDLLAAAGARPPAQESEDCGFVYYTRFFRSADGTLPPAMAPALSHFATHSLLTLGADNGTWSVTVFCASGDAALKGLRNADVWTKVVLAHPLHAHWLQGEALTGVLAMAGIMDTYRRFVVDGAPVATGFAAVGDAWAHTNPSAGRGIAVGLVHAEQLRRVVAGHLGAPEDLAFAFDEATERHAAPWYRLQVAMDRARLAGIEAARQGRPAPQPSDDRGRLIAALVKAVPYDADVFRAFVEMFVCVSTLDEILARPGMAGRISDVASRVDPMALPGPGRDAIVALAAA